MLQDPVQEPSLFPLSDIILKILMHILAILSGLIAASLALPLALKNPSVHTDREQGSAQATVASLAGGALTIGVTGGALYGAHQMGKKSAQREIYRENEVDKLSEYLRGYASGRDDERGRFKAVVELINECINNLVSDCSLMAPFPHHFRRACADAIEV